MQHTPKGVSAPTFTVIIALLVALMALAGYGAYLLGYKLVMGLPLV